MAWYRAGGGGIPSSLKTDMNDVLNKKFGTSQDYPPTDWAPTVNLMGPLPEKTVSGAIVTFSDGADEVPIKSWEVTLPASLLGYSSLNCYAYGKNLIDLSSLVFGYVKTNGAFETVHSNGEMRSGFIPVKPDTTYYFSIFETTGTAADWVGIGEYTTNDTSGFVRRDSYWRFTTGSTTKYIVVSARNLEQATKIQLEVGNDPTTWEAYQAPTVSTVNLGRTIYGWTVDVVKGQGESTFAKYIVTGQETGDFLSGTNNNGNRIGLIGFGLAQKPLYTGGVCNIDDSVNKACLNSGTWTIGSWCIYTDNKLYFVVPNEYTTFSSALQYLVDNNATFVFPLATPEPFTFSPITPTPETALGVNNFWADSGDTEVTYRADINLALGGQ